MKKANWCTVSGIFRVLRNILKRLSQEENEELIDVYLESLNSTLAKIPWSRMDTHFSNPHGTLGSVGNSEEGTVFLGNFVQFLSTLVQQVRFAEGSDASGTTRSILQKTIELVPDLLRWCQPKLESQNGSCMSRYLAHKLLVCCFFCLWSYKFKELLCFVSRYISDSFPFCRCWWSDLLISPI